MSEMLTMRFFYRRSYLAEALVLLDPWQVMPAGSTGWRRMTAIFDRLARHPVAIAGHARAVGVKTKNWRNRRFFDA
ncbi:MAG: hypothetical protein KFF68_15465 [Desulfosarcina sp.]|nr:hypothetical protein [Desulfosarcina sp.]